MQKYRWLFERYRRLISNGAFSAGDRLPSLRATAEAEGLGLNTVRAAWELLESEGLAKVRSRGGYYVRASRTATRPGFFAGGLSPAACREVEGLSASQKIEFLLSAGGAGGGFALAEPDAALLPVARLERLHATLTGSWIAYGDKDGEPTLRSRISAAYHQRNGGIDPAEILVTNGATEAIALAVRTLIEAGDEVAVESPTYYDFIRQLAAVRARIVEVPVRAGEGMDLDLLETRLERGRIRMIIVQPNVQNPTGTLMSDENKRRLVGLAARHGAFLVQDDVYGDLAFGRSPPLNLGALGGYEKLIYISSFSKTLAPGLRIGWMQAGSHRSELARAKGLSSLSTNRPAQLALAGFLVGAKFRKHLAEMRLALQTQLADYLEILSDRLPEGSSLAPPAGGCLLWLALPSGMDASKLFELAAREGILAAPGELFSANPFFQGHLRINFGGRLTEKRSGELRRLCDIARRLAKHR